MKKLILLLVLVAFACSTFMACTDTAKCEDDRDDCESACFNKDWGDSTDGEYNCTKKCKDEEDDCKEAAGCSGS